VKDGVIEERCSCDQYRHTPFVGSGIWVAGEHRTAAAWRRARNELESKKAMNCAICASQKITEVLDLGKMALAGAFLKPEDFGAEKTYPLRLGFCPQCLSLQVLDRIGQEKLFSRYFYRSSSIKTVREHFKAFAGEMVRRFAPSSVLEIGCNDGVALSAFADLGVTACGVDPSDASIADARVRRIRAYFNKQVAESLGKHAMVVANNVMAHVEDIHEVIGAVMRVLEQDGVFVFECHYLGSVVDGQYDAIYHEHVFYHSLLSMGRCMGYHSLQIFDVEPVDLHGGSMRFYACFPGKRQTSVRVHELLAQERSKGLDLVETYQAMAKSMLEHRRELVTLIDGLVKGGARIVGYGAAGRANTLLQWCGFKDQLAYIVDDCRGKHGYYTPGTHFEIREDLDEADYVLVLAWTYLEEIRAKVSKPLIVPFPRPMVVPA
jgi:methylation protein EvaC